MNRTGVVFLLRLLPFLLVIISPLISGPADSRSLISPVRAECSRARQNTTFYLKCVRDVIWRFGGRAEELDRAYRSLRRQYGRKRRAGKDYYVLAAGNCTFERAARRYLEQSIRQTLRLRRQAQDVFTLQDMAIRDAKNDLVDMGTRGILKRGAAPRDVGRFITEFIAGQKAHVERVRREALRPLIRRLDILKGDMQRTRVQERCGSRQKPVPNLGGPVPNLAGQWQCTQRCPAGRQRGYRPATITQNGRRLTFTNEGGGRSGGHFVEGSNTRIVATGWGGAKATVKSGGRTIRWDNGTIWCRNKECR